jgi:hypothetical protein
MFSSPRVRVRLSCRVSCRGWKGAGWLQAQGSVEPATNKVRRWKMPFVLARYTARDKRRNEVTCRYERIATSRSIAVDLEVVPWGLSRDQQSLSGRAGHSISSRGRGISAPVQVYRHNGDGTQRLLSPVSLDSGRRPTTGDSSGEA